MDQPGEFSELMRQKHYFLFNDFIDLFKKINTFAVLILLMEAQINNVLGDYPKDSFGEIAK